jgi:predicted transcriptional regulator
MWHYCIVNNKNEENMHNNLQRLLAEIIANYKERIALLNISQREFCRRAGIHENTLYNIKNPRITTLRKIEETLKKMGG